MNTNNHSSSLLVALPLAAFVLLAAACGPADSSSTSQTPINDAPNPLLLIEAPSMALSVANARAQVKPGEAIQVQGQIGGTRAPFLDGYAGFVLADPEIEFCNEMGDDHCSTPWDACCEDPDKLKAMRVSVQFIDAEGNPIQEDLKTTIGLKEQDEVAVIGTVDPSSTPTNMIIQATGLYNLPSKE